MTISSDQLHQRDLWESRWRRGEVPMGDALHSVLQSGAPVSKDLAEAVMDAIDRYARGEASDLAEEFGIERVDGNEAQAITAEILARNVYDLVMELHHERGLPRSRGDGIRETAFSAAARVYKLSEARVVALYQRGKQLLDAG